ncbi:metal-response element-binding transcription factor 2-like protein [Dinothrombium tinctorium]|uniref:Metal-response element-binding transcription factor 2-like protein n=1 Tax=Dinothrombium tinctorium TaxID=1965070 RepID=A0A3S3P7M5_9ACAR|nr:metal-response element-binding transcription factor 2-like protein [Dinothrombium tinctorium]
MSSAANESSAANAANASMATEHVKPIFLESIADRCKEEDSELSFGRHTHEDSDYADDEDDELNAVVPSGKTSITSDWIFVGSTVLCLWKNGLYYLGVIEKVDTFSEHCLVRYEDYSIYWSPFKDLHKQLSTGTVMSDSDILCAVCRDGTSKSPNEIVICDICNQGYHQQCHKPSINDEVLKPDVPWSCRKCVFALAAKEGGAEKNTSIGQAMAAMKTVLPYDLNSLHWDSSHYVNKQNTYCYCGGPGEYFSKMLQCHECKQWFHEACIQCLEVPLLYGDHYYTFTCAVCNNGKECVKRIIMKWSDMVALVLNNLSLSHQKAYFDLNSDIIPFIQKNCEKFTLNVDLSTMKEKDLLETISKILNKYNTKFKNFSKDSKRKSNLWALKVNPANKPSIFAPPYAITGENSFKPSKTQNSPNHPSARMSCSPLKSLSYPLVYGACRKGASFYPKPSRVNLKNDKREGSCAASTSSNSSSNCSQHKILKTKRKRCPTKMKAKSSSSVTSDCSEVEETSNTVTLDTFIPRPDNFEGVNNPFYDLDLSGKKDGKRRKLVDDKGYRIISKSDNSSKLTLQRISSQSGDKLVAQSDEQTLEKLARIEQRFERGEKYTVLARRLTKDGRVEYLLEWDTFN